MLFTRAQVLRTVHFCGKASSGSRNITVNDFWPASIIALVPCNHPLAVCFPLQRAGTRPLCKVYWDIWKQGRPVEFLSDQKLYHLNRGLLYGAAQCLVLHTPLHVTHILSVMGILIIPKPSSSKNIISANCLASYSWLLPPLLELTAFHMCLTNPIHNDSPDKQSSNWLPGYPTESRE